MGLIDTHCHLNDSKFSSDLSEVLNRASEAGVDAVVVVGWDVGSSRRAIELAENHQSIYAAVGVHPHDASDATPETLTTLRRLADHDQVVAVGETGIDLYRELSPLEDQRNAFVRFIEMAVEVQKPLIIHSREADEEVLEVLADNPPGEVKMVRHCFSGGVDLMERYLDLDCWLGIAGPVTYPNAETLRKVAAVAPPDRLVVETDCPWLPPQEQRGERNEPALVAQIAEKIAEARDIAPERIARMTSRNARELYQLPD